MKALSNFEFEIYKKDNDVVYVKNIYSSIYISFTMKQEDNEITTWLKTLIIAIGIINDIVLQRNHQLERENNLDFSSSALEIECLECK